MTTHPVARQRGATAVLVALMLVPIVGFVALAVDVSSHVRARQRLWDTIDAAALGGVRNLPDGVAARNAALSVATSNEPALTPTISFWCVIGADGAGSPIVSHIPVTCDPGPGPYDAVSYPGMACDQTICAIPCDPLPPQSDQCNTIEVTADQTVPYRFAPVVGWDQGNTGTLSTGACRGSCGVGVDSPADVALAVDRTGSMGAVDIAALKDASRAFLEELSPVHHHVALVTIGRTDPAPPPQCPTSPSPNGNNGPWVAVSLRDDYDLTDNTPPDNPPDLNSTSLVVVGLDCLTNSSTGTNLGDPMTAAGSYLLNNGRAVPKGILLMTDGAANEPGVASPCDYARQQAAPVEAAGVVIITIAYRLQNVDCDGTPATTILAEMASDPVTGPATMDDGGDGPGGLAGGCQTADAIDSENADGDNFFCAPQHDELVAAFILATQALTVDLDPTTRLIRLPG